MTKLKYDEALCPACAEPIKAAASKCKHCGHAISQADIEARLKKSSEDSKNGLIGCGVLAVIGAIVLATCSGDSGEDEAWQSEPSASINEGQPDSNGTETESTQSMTGPQQNAVRSARSYIEMKGFSRQGLIDQLSSEYGSGYDVEAATFAVDYLGVDWNEQATRSAQSYLEMRGFSCNGLVEQLSSEYGSQYTAEQARYGATQAGAC